MWFDSDMSESCSFRQDNGSDEENFSSGDKDYYKMKLWTEISLVMAACMIVILVLLRLRKE